MGDLTYVKILIIQLRIISIFNSSTFLQKKKRTNIPWNIILPELYTKLKYTTMGFYLKKTMFLNSAIRRAAVIIKDWWLQIRHWRIQWTWGIAFPSQFDCSISGGGKSKLQIVKNREKNCEDGFFPKSWDQFTHHHHHSRKRQLWGRISRKWWTERVIKKPSSFEGYSSSKSSTSISNML